MKENKVIVRVVPKAKLQKFVFTNDNRTLVCVVTIEEIRHSGFPIDPESGYCLQYLGVAAAKTEMGQFDEEIVDLRGVKKLI